MLEELKGLKKKPSREKNRREADDAADRAYGRAYRQATMDAAKAEGAAAGMADATGGMDVPTSAIEAARQRALGGGAVDEAPASAPIAPSTSVRTVKLADGTEVPEQFYDLSAEDKKRMLELIKQRKQKKADDSVALTSINQMLDLRDKDAIRLKALEDRIVEQDRMIATLATALEQQNNSIEVNRSSELSDQLLSISDSVLNAASVEASLRNQTAASKVEMERQGAEVRAGLEAQATAIDALRSSVSSTTGLMSERSARVEDQVAVAEANLRRVEAGMAEVDGQVEAIGRPITRAEVNTMVTDAIAEQWREQLPALTEAVAQMMLDMYPGGVAGQRMDPELVRRQRSDAANYLDPVRGA